MCEIETGVTLSFKSDIERNSNLGGNVKIRQDAWKLLRKEQLIGRSFNQFCTLYTDLLETITIDHLLEEEFVKITIDDKKR